MIQRKTIFTTFLIVFLISILLVILSRFGALSGLTSFLSKVTYPIQRSTYGIFGRIGSSEKALKNLQKENLELNKKFLDQIKLEKDIQALRDQFAVSNPSSSTLLPAAVIGFPSFIPNVSTPETLLIDKGLDDGIRVGQAVIFKDNLVGKIQKVTSDKSLIYLITHPDFTFTAKILNKKTEGVVRGLGGGDMILDNVLLSDVIGKGDMIITKGDLTINNVGFPSGLIVGKVLAIDKTPSALFQTAGVKSLVDFSRLETVFIYIGNK
jgi:rod shape-determining protein MreC